MIVVYGAQGNGQAERMHRTLEEHLRCFVGPLQDDWDSHLVVVHSTVNSSTKLAPFEADVGYIPLNPLQLAAEQLEEAPKNRRGSSFHERQAAILLRCRAALSQVQERMRDIYDRNRTEQVFEVGDHVHKHLDPKHTGLPNSTKFGPKWIGPCTVMKIGSTPDGHTYAQATERILVEWMGEEKPKLVAHEAQLAHRLLDSPAFGTYQIGRRCVYDT
ncbi:hypothetical protein PC128_g4687 [Phytophthora cactorum]|nr:hypothetical protein PC128_g4687 [Phytophthora cactorum]